jgi:hypothetical protein
MEEIKAPKKERKFLKAVGNIAKFLANELVMGIARKFIGKAIDNVGNKRQGLSIVLIILASSFAFAQFPNTGNKQRLGFQTTADGLVWRGSISDTASIQPINNQNAWVILDTVNLKMYSFDFTSNVWNLVGGGGAAFTQPVDSLFFNVSVPTNNVDTAKMRWDSDLATVVLGLNDNVPNELGFKNFWLVKNQTGSTITKGSLVYANGTVGASGRITVAKFIANGSIDAKYLLGITAHDLTDGEDGYVISFGKIRQVNTDTFAAGAILYPSPTVAGVWTDVEPIAPNIDMPIGFCINSSVNNGTIAIRVASGYKLSELHDVSITSPVDRSSLYYRSGLWRDTTAALLTSDTASMLTPYFRDADTTSLNLTSRFAAKLNISDTASMLTNYLRTGTAASTYLPLTGGTLSGDLGISKSSNSILRLSSADVGSYGKLIFSSNDGGFLNYGASIESSGDGVGVDVGSLNFLTGFGTVRTNRMTITPTGNLTIVNSATIGGTLGVTGALTGTTGTFTGLNINNTTTQGIFTLQGADNNTPTRIDFKTGNEIRRQIIVPTAESNMQFRTSTIGGTQGGYSFYTRRNPNPSEFLAFNIDVDGNSNFYGTLGVTGATTLSAPLTVNSSAVFNEGSTDSDFRVESDGNANMVFVDASTDRVGIGYASPTKTLDVNGTLGVFGATNLSNTLTVDGKTILNDSARFEGNILFKKNMGLPIVKISNADYTATTDNHTIIYTTLTSDKTLTIPNASNAVGVKFIISIFDIPEGNEALTLVTPSSNLFVRTDGENSSVDIVGGYCTTIQSDGTKWYILSYAPMY